MVTLGNSPRMTRLTLLLFTLLTTALCDAGKVAGSELSVTDPGVVGMSREKLQMVGNAVQGFIRDKRIAGASVMISRKGKIVYAGNFGLRDIENKKPMTEDTIFRVYSMTKAVTSVAAMILVESGQLRLEDKVSKHLPAFTKAQVWKDAQLVAPRKPATVKDLLCHTSGYSYGDTGIQEIDAPHLEHGALCETTKLSDFSTQAARIPMAFEPGAGWLYGISTDLLGAVVERASGMALDQFFESRIFTPLGMIDTGFIIPEDKRMRLAAAYNSDNQGSLSRRNSDLFTYSSRTRLLSGGGGLASTILDYTRFLQMIANGGEWNGQRLLQKKTVETMTRNHLSGPAMPIRFPGNIRHGTGFGLGFSVKTAQTDWNKAGRLGEYGWGGMLSTHFWISPADQLVVVTMEQTYPFDFLLEDALKPLIYAAIE